ncbi:translation initiation factor IF-2 [Desulfurococcaceae archaeon AG1]|jgi:translation initiation factor 5B|nr:translation initiation factor IF-2 [Desulfurococcaceae archaeon AG1]
MGEARRLRSPIVVVLGHVDHGKTTLLDKIRGTAVVKKEPGEMTQHVGASFVPTHVIESIAEPLKKFIRFRLRIPGLLFIDTPGHEAFANLRRRGGSIADLAVLVIDIIDGVKPQTIESIEILKDRSVPFVIAANKIDRIQGWRSFEDTPFMESSKKQDKRALEALDRNIYSIVGSLSSLGIEAERFDRVRDFRKTTPIVPVSAKTGEGLPELLAVLAGIAQQYLEERLVYAEGPAKGVVLEVKEEQGLGTTIDAIIYDGVMKRGDIIVLGGFDGAIITKVRALLLPKPLDEMRAPTDRFNNVEEVYAAAGVKISAPNLEKAIAGSPILVAQNEEEAKILAAKISEEIGSLRISSQDTLGLVVKADTLGTLEALVSMLKKRNIPIRIADVGPLSKREAIEAAVVSKDNRYLGAVLLFNVGVNSDAEEILRGSGVKLFQGNIIYRLVEDYIEWVNEEKRKERERELEKLVRAGKIRIIPGYVFRRSDPAIVGVEILGGVIRPGYPLMREDGRSLGTIMQIQDAGKTINIARTGMSVAISIRGNILIGRHVNEGDIIYTDIPENHVNELVDRFAQDLSNDELLVLKEIIEIKRKSNKLFATSSYIKLLQILGKGAK